MAIRGYLKLSLLLGVLASAQGIPELSLEDLSGATRSLADYRGQVIVLNFWATWCVPCREEMPLLVAVERRYRARGVVVIGASADTEDTQPQIPGFLQEVGVTFPIWKNATTEHMERLGLGLGLPATAVIDQDGRVAFRILGVLEHRDLAQRIDFLLRGRRGRSPEPLLDRIGEAPHQEGEEDHRHGGVGMEGASTVPS